MTSARLDLSATETNCFRWTWQPLTPSDLTGGATYSTTRLSKTRAAPQDWHPPTPVDSSGTYKLLARSPWVPDSSSTRLTKDGGSLLKELSNECMMNKLMFQTLHSSLKSPAFSHQSSSKTKENKQKKTRVRRRSRSPPPKKKKQKPKKVYRYSSSSENNSDSNSSCESTCSTSSSNSKKQKPIYI